MSIPAKHLIPIVAAVHFQKPKHDVQALIKGLHNENYTFWGLESWRSKNHVLILAVDLQTGNPVDIELWPEFVRFYFPRIEFKNAAQVRAALQRFLSKLPPVAEDLAIAWPDDWHVDEATDA